MEIDWIPSLVAASFSRELNLLYIVLKDVNLVGTDNFPEVHMARKRTTRGLEGCTACIVYVERRVWVCFDLKFLKTTR